MLVKGYQKIEKFLNVISYFATRTWLFRNKNTRNLWTKLNEEDQKLFMFDMGRFEWDSYFYTYIRGGRVYLLKDPLDTIPQGRVKYYKLKLAHYTLVTVLALIFLKLILVLWNLIF
ncbi:fatty acyl-CoA reductase wat-like [Agrilus planipennis]|nr:fatty acyl-CoA reductase wat-like [Agrilus planipennis]